MNTRPHQNQPPTPTRPVAATADSQETGQEQDPASNAIDGDPETFWHTDWSVPPVPGPPHHLTVDLGSARSVCGVRYLPRQDGSENGRIAKYEVYTSTDGQTWGSPVATGTLANTTDEKWIPFAQNEARYVKLVALSEVNGNPLDLRRRGRRRCALTLRRADDPVGRTRPGAAESATVPPEAGSVCRDVPGG